ncbi:MAG: hypothetical protein JW878_07045 [Methanomicrobia archaeon]|nr:hypothetical protein [Methanomicrobia archaeon]
MVSAALELVLQLIAQACMFVGMVYLVTYTRYFHALVTGYFTLQNHAISVLVSTVVSRFSDHETAEAFRGGEV